MPDSPEISNPVPKWLLSVGGTVLVPAAGLAGLRHMVIAVWLIVLALALMTLALCLESKYKIAMKVTIALASFAVLCASGFYATGRVRAETPSPGAGSPTQVKTHTENRAVTREANSPAIAGGTGNSVSYGSNNERRHQHSNEGR